MKKHTLIFAFILASLCLAGCADFSPFNTKKNVLIIKPSSTTRAENGVVGEDGSMIYSIDKATTFGCYPAAYIHSFYYIFFKEDAPDIGTAGINCIQDARIEYSKREDMIHTISIGGIDESLGFGNIISIWMNQGKYESALMHVGDSVIDATDLIESVEIISFKEPSSYEEPYEDNYLSSDDATFHIVIKSKSGGMISLFYSGIIQAIPTT